MSYVETKLVNAAGKMAKLLATDMYLDGQGQQSQPIQLDGMAAAISDGTADGQGTFPTYGGITRADISSTDNYGINSYVKANIGTLSLAATQTAFGSCWFGNEHIDLMPCPQPVWDIFWNKIQPQQRFLEESSDLAKIGFIEEMEPLGASPTVN
jgi:hypothetical protein